MNFSHAGPVVDSDESKPTPPQLLDAQELDNVWSGHRVGFYLLTVPPYQYVAYYDADRQMTIAQRRLDSSDWTYKRLPSKLGWDSHNYIVMALDKEGYIHVSGNMHVNPLVYFRSTQPYDVTTLEAAPMTGRDEQRVTYPRFMKNADGDLVFYYRDGSSGNGVNYYNIYDTDTQKWKRLIDRSILDGESMMNAYPLGPTLGPDGYYHMSWVWRDTVDCETNHDLSYARSRDLVHWETAAGEPLKLPLTIETPGLIVDPIPVEGGIINGSGKIGFDSKGRVVLTYHKFDEQGNTQLYHARWEDDHWQFYQTSDWDYRWYFSGGGSIESTDVRHGSVAPAGKGLLKEQISHVKYPSGEYLLSEEDFSVVDILKPDPAEQAFYRKLYRVESDFPGMKTVRAYDQGEDLNPGEKYILQWETLPPNRDVARPKPWPEPSPLRLFKVSVDENP
ncbi:BNR-4 repeat-containing protein [Ruficoccus amylovorans]|uniref:BNR-4 repeat-containing protein n=1 Tax=Ruficoccus amylovorans TaxID=1804625 RepID=A0A842HKD7_9BACT|nr:BNR repeat-containing protein [Ruficoccus amylovorans]MBC2596006.1 BNR-4 repeat-containing protein [Ruficoccus amylovorans]